MPLLIPTFRTPLVALVSLAALLVMLAAPAFAQSSAPVASVNTGALNVRSGPGLEFGALLTLPRGYGVMLLARNAQANWVLIMLADGTRGWVNVNYLYTTYRISQLPIDETAQASPVVPTARNNNFIAVNVRSGPAADAPVVAVIPAGGTAALLGRNFNSTWAQVRLPDGTTGWVAPQNVVTSVPVRSLAPSDGSIVAPLPPTTGTGSQRPPVAGSPQPGTRTYVIRRGDTLSAIARRFNVDMRTLARLNNIVNVDRIFAGQRLVIP